MMTTLPSKTLSPQRLVILTMIAEGHTNDEIAAKLYMAPHTVRTHIQALLRGMGARNRTHATCIGMHYGLIHPDGSSKCVEQRIPDAISEIDQAADVMKAMVERQARRLREAIA